MDHLYSGNLNDLNYKNNFANFNGYCPLRYINLSDSFNNRKNNINGKSWIDSKNSMNYKIDNFSNNAYQNLNNISIYEKINYLQRNFNNNIKFIYMQMLENLKNSLDQK